MQKKETASTVPLYLLSLDMPVNHKEKFNTLSQKYVFTFPSPPLFFSTPKTQQDISQIASPAAAETLELFVPLASVQQRTAAPSRVTLNVGLVSGSGTVDWNKV